jgi:hypothetical protein
MSRVRWLAFMVTVAAMAGLGAVACGGGGGQAPTPEVTVVPGTPVLATVIAGTIVPGTAVAGTPMPEPTVTGTHLEYPSKGYAVDFPDGWKVDSNVVTYDGLTADAFFAPNEIAGVQPSISVSREDLSDTVSPVTYVDTKVNTAQGLGAKNLQVTSGSSVAGREASVISYTRVLDGVQLEKRDVVFVDDGHGWVITLATPAGQGASFYPLFDAFLGSFKLLAPAQASSTPIPG